MKTRFTSLALALGLFFGACDTATNDPATGSNLLPGTAGSVSPGNDASVTIPAGNSVRLTFVPKANATYLISTIGNTDTYLELRDSSGNKTLAIDQNSTGLNGQISYTALTTAPLTILVSGQTATTSGASIVTIKMTNGPDDYESDNSLSTAKAITTDGVVQNRTLGIGDTDWVKIPVDSGNTYRVAGSGTNTLYIKIFGADSSVLAAETSSYTTFLATKTGFVYARLNYYYASSSYTGAYTVNVTSSGPDAYESDNKLSTAKTITTDGVAQNRTLGIGDTDWVKIPVDSGKTYKVAGSGANTLYFKIFNADSTVLIAETSSYTTFLAPKTGFIYARINYYYANASYTGAYTVNVTSIASLTDAYESDNKLSTAKAITTDGVVQSRTLGIGDTDWVKIPVDSGKTYKVAGSGTNTLYFKIFNADSTVLVAETSSYTAFLAPKTGFVYARINYYYASASYTGAYTVNVTSIASLTDAYESDNSLSTAKAITTDGVVQNRTLGIGDTDWVKIPVDSGKTYKVAGSGANTLYFKVFNADSTVLASESSSSVSFTALKTGFVYARINYYYANANYTGAYTVNVTSSGPDAYESDNSLSTAKAITTDGLAQNRNLGIGDTDWVKIPVDSGKTYNIAGSGANTLYFKVFNADSTVLKAETSGSVSFTALKTGFVYARINYYYANASYTGAYSVYVTSIASLVDAYEPDNTRAQASLLATNGTTQSHNLQAGEHDWIKAEMVAGTTYTIYITNSSPDYNYVTDFYESMDATTYFKSVTTSYTTTTSYTPTTTGACYFDFHGYSTSSNGPYTISIIAN